MFQLQPDKNNIFRRIWIKLQVNPETDIYLNWSEWRLKFEACKLTIESIRGTLYNTQAWDIQDEDLKDYADALLDINLCLEEFRTSEIGTLYLFSNIITPLEQAIIYLGGALGINNYHAPSRTRNIHKSRSWLNKALEQIEGLGEPPDEQPP
jgi:hypothetical protein